MIVSISSGGLGNQLFRFFAALNYALKFKQELQIDKSSFPKKNDSELLLVQRKFDLTDYGAFHKHSRVPYTKNPPPNWLYRIDNLPPLVSANLGVLSEKNYHIARTVSPKKYAIDDFQNLEFLPDANLMLEFFDSLLDRPNWLMEGIRKAEIIKPVFLHIRLTDYLNYPDTYPIPSTKYYSDAIALIRKKSPFTEVWLFSDDPVRAIQYLGGTIKNLKVIDIPQNAKPSEVLEMMSHGAGLVMGNSTFSWWGAYLSKLRNQKVSIVMPNRFTNLVNDPARKLRFDGVSIVQID